MVILQYLRSEYFDNVSILEGMDMFHTGTPLTTLYVSFGLQRLQKIKSVEGNQRLYGRRKTLNA
ncbi:hypothetical protein C0J52_17525 [Blattella germanica]|nr:hypothetical protein C0J52_17525 [Blattella germanica]